MGQKVNPLLMRIGYTREASSRWYAKGQQYVNRLHQDIRARNYLDKTYGQSGISQVHIERPGQNANVVITCARPATLIGRKGEGVSALSVILSKLLGVPAHVSVKEASNPNIDATLVAAGIAQQLEKRVLFRKAMKRALKNAKKSGAKGIKICVAGRLGGAEIARTEWARQGAVPLHTFRADIDYGVALAHTTYGVIGIKVWIYKGDAVIKKEQAAKVEEEKRKKSSGEDS
jgi:small subunit ribosomal protein S3